MFKKFFIDKEGNVVIGQAPNLPIILAFVSWVLSKILNGMYSDLAYYGFIVFLFWWATLELFSGVNYFRRLLGILSVLFLIYVIFNKLL